MSCSPALAPKASRRLVSVPLPRVAAALGPALGPDWDVVNVVRYVAWARRGRQLLTNPAAPLAYLRRVLHNVLSDLDHAPATRHTLARWRAAEGDRELLRAHQAAAAAPAAGNPAVAALGAKVTANAAARAA